MASSQSPVRRKHKFIPACGNKSILTISKLASMHDIKMVFPATIYIGSEINRFIYTDPITGYVKQYSLDYVD